MRFLRRKEVENKTGLSRSTIYANMTKGSFPLSVKIGDRAVAWREADIDEWMRSRVECG